MAPQELSILLRQIRDRVASAEGERAAAGLGGVPFHGVAGCELTELGGVGEEGNVGGIGELGVVGGGTEVELSGGLCGEIEPSGRGNGSGGGR
jgi:hypothetical protein